MTEQHKRESFMREGDKDILKQAFKEGMREWLDEKFSEFGKWSMRGIAAMALVAMTWFILVSQGWHK